MLCIALRNDYKKNLTYIFNYFNLPYIKRESRLHERRFLRAKVTDFFSSRFLLALYTLTNDSR